MEPIDDSEVPDEPDALDALPDGESLILDRGLDVPIGMLKPHPRNYNGHPPDQIEQIAASIRQSGFYRNVVVARDWTLLAGHGTVEAAALLGREEVPTVRLDLDPMEPRALKILVSDNELSRFAAREDRLLTGLLTEIRESSPLGLFGTGYDEMILANLIMVTRPASEIQNIDAAAEWAGMPDYVPEGETWKLIIQFKSKEDRLAFIDAQRIRELITLTKFSPHAVSGWWPKQEEITNDAGIKWESDEDPPDLLADPAPDVIDA
jgi:hypothetical protein